MSGPNVRVSSSHQNNKNNSSTFKPDTNIVMYTLHINTTEGVQMNINPDKFPFRVTALHLLLKFMTRQGTFFASTRAWRGNFLACALNVVCKLLTLSFARK